MSGSEAAPTIPSVATSVRSEQDELERRIEERIRSVGRRIGWVELSWRLLIWLVGVVGFLLVFTVCDQWLFSRGMPTPLRWTAWSLVAGLSAAWLGLAVGPYLLHRIHPLFAAYVLEKAFPGLKHAVMGFLLLRERRQDFEHDPLSKHVFLGLERKAAATVETVALDSVVDRAQVVRWAAVLAGVIAAFCLYVVFSPKNALVSTARVLIPWADIAPATRVRIEDVSPGNAEVTAGDRVIVTAHVFGLRSGEEPRLHFSTADGQFSDQVIPLRPVDGESSRFSAELFPAIPCDTTYRIEAADAETKAFRIRVLPTVRLEVQSLELEYPPYTRLGKKTLTGTGDISAIEGTRVTVSAQASVPLRDAEIELDDGRIRIPMQRSGEGWLGRFTLKMSKKDPNIGEFTSYALRGTDEDGRRNRDPVRFSIATIPDRPPWVDFQDPPADGSVIPVNAATTLHVKAQDPDFGLNRLALYLEKGGRSIHSSVLLETPPSESGSTEIVTKSFELRPAELNLQPGDTVFCWSEALDNREPTANRVESRRLQLVIGESTPSDNAQPQQPNAAGGDASAENRSDRSDSPSSDAAPEKNGKNSANGQDRPPPSNQGSTSENSASLDGQQNPEPADASSGGDGQPQPSDNNRPDQSKPSEGGSDAHQGQQGMEGQGAQSGSQSGGASSGSQSADGTGSQSQSGSQSESGGTGQSSAASQSAGSNGNSGGDSPSTTPDGQAQRPSPANSGNGAGQGDPAAMQETGGGRDAEGAQSLGDGKGPTAGAVGQEGSTPADTSESGESGNSGRNPTSNGDGGRSGKPPSPADGQNNPGEAFERILKYLQEKGRTGTPGGEGTPDPAVQQESPANSPSEGTTGSDRPGAEKPSPNAAEGADSPQERPQGSGTPGESGPERGFPAGDNTGQDSDDPDSQSPRGGGESPANPSAQSGASQPGAAPEDAAMGTTPPPGSQTQGRSPQGTQSSETPPQASRSPQTEGASESSPEPQASTDPSSRDSSQTQSENSGTLPGGGREGQGQSSPQSGFGTPGSQSPATTGGEAMRDPNGPESGGPNGTDGRASANQGSQQGGAETSARSDEAGDSGRAPSVGQRSPGNGNPRGGGLPGDADSAPVQRAPRPDSADEPIVEFARKQTDLALRYLEEELAKNTPDPELLDRLGWTREDMERFAQRWRELRDKAEVPTADSSSARQFREVLKSLGLRPRGTELRSGRGANDSQRGLGTPRQTAPPPQWSEQYREYLKALGKSQ
ncbi:hypothetical protein [Thermopirellula anaerolimosa]